MTTLWSPDALRTEIVGLPAGIGYSLILKWEDTALPLKSRYVRLDEDQAAEWGSQLNLQPLAQTSIGTIYLNKDADCG